jgi:hypothetical protein
MRNVKKYIGEGFKFEKSLFGVAINGWSASKFNHKDGRIVVGLEKNDAVSDSVIRFAGEQAFESWKDRIYEGLSYQDGSLLVRAFPSDFSGFCSNND